RPGPMGANMHYLYADRKDGRKPIEPLHPAIAPLLEDTYQIMVYQEQVMQVAPAVAGDPMAEADNLRKAIGRQGKSAVEDAQARRWPATPWPKPTTCGRRWARRSSR